MIIYQNLRGHHLEYAQCCSTILDQQEVGHFDGSWEIFKFFFKEKVFLVTIDNCFISFFVFAILRSIMKLRTVGILIRSNNIHKQGVKYRIKKHMLRILRGLRKASVINIIDPEFIPDHNLYFNAYIPDLMFFDSQYTSNIDFRNLPVAKINTTVEIKKINFIGFITPEKGRDRLLDFLTTNPQITLQHYGETPDFYGIKPPQNIRLNGWYDSKDELNIFDGTTPTWCFFDDSYNLSSAAFCKSIKYGNVPIVRCGSYLHGFASKHSIMVLTLEDKHLKLQNQNAKSNFRFNFNTSTEIARVLKFEYSS